VSEPERGLSIERRKRERRKKREEKKERGEKRERRKKREGEGPSRKLKMMGKKISWERRTRVKMSPTTASLL